MDRPNHYRLWSFLAEVKVNSQIVNAEFIVVKGSGPILLGRETNIKLQLVFFGHVQDKGCYEDLPKRFKCFSGLGKLRDFKLKLHIDESIQPVAQQARRIPFSLRDKVEREIENLLEADVIEPAQGPTPWISPVVVVPKPNGDVRLCVDMRRANEAVVRERHPIPTIDEVLHELSHSKHFSKLDLRKGYHQIELSEDSKPITTFITHKGLFRYKRLMFGISSAPESYQHIIQQVLLGCEGAANISDNIIVHGKTKDEHDRRLEQVVKRLEERGLTVNPAKCEFNLDRRKFMATSFQEMASLQQKIK